LGCRQWPNNVKSFLVSTATESKLLHDNPLEKHVYGSHRRVGMEMDHVWSILSSELCVDTPLSSPSLTVSTFAKYGSLRIHEVRHSPHSFPPLTNLSSFIPLCNDGHGAKSLPL
jgi:hypothetical protein